MNECDKVVLTFSDMNDVTVVLKWLLKYFFLFKKQQFGIELQN